MKKKKKYAVGGTSIDIQTPQEFDFMNKRMGEEAFIEGMNDSTAMGLNMLGNVFTDMGFSMIGADKKGGGGKFENFMRKNGQTMGNFARTLSNFAALGGTMGTKVEAEGEELMETPNGLVQELQGPSHEGGGIDMIVPQGTDFYSKRLKGEDGKTMAERKKHREKTISRLEKLIKNNPQDKILKNTLNKIKENNEFIDSKDVDTMNFVRSITEATQKYSGGGTVPKYVNKDFNYNFFKNIIRQEGLNDLYDFNTLSGRKKFQKSLGIKDDGFFGKQTNTALANKYKLKPVSTIKSASVQPISENYNYLDKSTGTMKQGSYDLGPTTPGLSNTPLVGVENPDIPNFLERLLGKDFGSFDSLVGKAGDALGMLGKYKAMNAGVDMVQKNRDGDTANINAFKNFGVDALNAVKESKGYIAGQQERALQEIEANRLGSVRNNRNTARGINTMRALDMVSSMSADKARGKTLDSFSQQMMQILGQQANLENVQDQVVMQEEQNRDLADRKDRDNYFTQMSQVIQSKNLGLQHIGKDLNQMRERSVKMNLINQLSKYGLTLDADGNLVKKD